MATSTDTGTVAARLASSELRRTIERYVRRKVPAGDVEDVVQTVLCDALAAPEPPSDERALRQWALGIARHKIADYHRRGPRHLELDPALAAEQPAASVHEWAEWAERQVGRDPEARRTLDWMTREGGGEKLAHIAAEERLPATQIRQRVSRLRRWMRAQWRAELAAVAGLGVAALVAWWLVRERQAAQIAEPILPVPRIELSAPPPVAPPPPERPAIDSPKPSVAPPTSAAPPRSSAAPSKRPAPKNTLDPKRALDPKSFDPKRRDPKRAFDPKSDEKAQQAEPPSVFKGKK